MPTCQEVAEHATEFLERAMPRRQRFAVWAHLRICPNCRAYLRQLMRTVSLTRRAGASGPPPSPQEEDRLVAIMKAARPPRPD